MSPEALSGSKARRVRELAEKRRAVILAHNYQVREVQEVADFLGDSYALARAAKGSSAEWIVFCGVRFMAETAKLLDPGKRVVLPESMAGCDLAASISVEGLRMLKRRHPAARTVMYINCSVEVKAEADAICTSSNALRVVEAQDSEEVILGPDRNLAAFVAKRTAKRIVPWEGFCPIHERMSLEVFEAALAHHPGAYAMVHPECPPEVQSLADAVLSTSQMVEAVERLPYDRYLVGTELGLIEQLQCRHPEKQFWPVYEHKSCDESCACPYMKMTRLDSVLKALETGEESIEVGPELAGPALRAVERMLEIGGPCAATREATA